MRVVRSKRGVREQIREWRGAGERVAFVPTMGSFHEGHLSLMRRARRVADRVVLSIYVNPTQFAPHEDFAAYPRDTRRDLLLARGERVDLAYLPAPTTFYASDHATAVRVTGLESVLEGASRPGHFAGVALVVLKLLHLTEPDVLVLGRKDAQQALILERMIGELDLPVRVVRAPIVRDHDGLALSSRNRYLNPDQRAAALVLSRSLREVVALVRGGERSATRLKNLVRRAFAREPGALLDYVAVVDAHDLVPVARLCGRVLVPLAAHVGKTRLIDNAEFTITPGRKGR